MTVARHPDRLFFGPRWSPDGAWLVFQGCRFKEDPGHDWADLYLARPDGSECRAVTTDCRQWFGTSYGSPATRGGGSELPEWSPDGQTVTYTRAVAGARTAWEFQPQRPDTDHFNREYRPDLARGGTELCLLNPFTGATRVLTPHEPGVWNFRARWSPDGTHIAFCRARVGEPAELWVMRADGSSARLLTRGDASMGADHPRWMQG
jgi:TolB protein